MTYIENPKTAGSGIVCCIPQKGECPIKCEDCFFQSGRSFLEPLEENLPNIPTPEMAKGKIVRMNDGNDSNVEKELVIETALQYENFFFNTSRPKLDFPGPVVFTINPANMTNVNWWRLNPIPENLMFVRIRVNMWNLFTVVKHAVNYYSANEVPIVLTFMAYYNTPIPKGNEQFYEFKKRTLNSYNVITKEAFDVVMSMFEDNKWVYSCGSATEHSCKFCGNCLREYYATKERMNSEW